MPSPFRSWLDRLGATGSLVCAVHCAVLPLLIALLPALGLSGWLGEGFERMFVVFASLLGVFSLASGYRRGCDIVLHCNGLMDEMKAVVKEVVPLSGKALQRAEAVQRGFAAPDASDEQALRAEFHEMMAVA